MVVELSMSDFAGELAIEKIILSLVNAWKVTVWAQIETKLWISTFN